MLSGAKHPRSLTEQTTAGTLRRAQGDRSSILVTMATKPHIALPVPPAAVAFRPDYLDFRRGITSGTHQYHLQRGVDAARRKEHIPRLLRELGVHIEGELVERRRIKRHRRQRFGGPGRCLTPTHMAEDAINRQQAGDGHSKYDHGRRDAANHG